MNRVLIPKASEDAIKSENGHTFFKRAVPECDSAWAVMDNRIYMHCKGVYGFSLLTNHTIEPNGEVSASVLCQDGMGGEYHEWVTLEGWPSDMRKNPGEDMPIKI